MTTLTTALTITLFVTALAIAADTNSSPTTQQAWHPAAPRDEIRPIFAIEPTAGRSATESLTIRTDARPGQIGWYTRTFPITGGQWYRFQAWRKFQNVPCPRRSILALIRWQDDKGQMINRDEPANVPYLSGQIPEAEPELPPDTETDNAGWTQLTGVYRAPTAARQAVIELQLCWAPDAQVQWSDITFTRTDPKPARKVRLAAVHFLPTGGKSNDDNCRLFASLIAQAAAQKADLVVLGETLTYCNRGLNYDQCAEPIPGPSTQYFHDLAKKHNLYIVPGLLERDKNAVYNTAALIGPEGLVGKYRKVCLTRDEVANGVTPGDSYPVFQTRFGKVGMMICYDGFFPEVARQLGNNGAEVIAWPVWGCSPLMAAARAIDNHVYLVSSTYCIPADNWMLTAIWSQDGIPLAQAKDFGTITIAEVDLNKPLLWSSMGDFKAEQSRRRPPWPADKP